MIAHDGTEIRSGGIYLAKAACGLVPKSGWRKVTVTEVHDHYVMATAPGDFGTRKLGPKDIKLWVGITSARDPLLDETPRARPPAKKEIIPENVTGFEYPSGKFVFHTRKEWKEKVKYCRDYGGRVEVPYGMGETWLYLPAGKNSKKMVLFAEIYSTGY
jgi:hypothetical protein